MPSVLLQHAAAHAVQEQTQDFPASEATIFMKAG